MPVAEPQLDQMFSALADPTRRAILSRLSTGDATVNELAAPFDLTVQAVSKHIKVLEGCGLVSRSRVRQARPCRLEPEALDPAIEWIEQHRKIWNERLDKLDEHLRHLQQEAGDRSTEPRSTKKKTTQRGKLP